MGGRLRGVRQRFWLWGGLRARVTTRERGKKGEEKESLLHGGEEYSRLVREGRIVVHF